MAGHLSMKARKVAVGTIIADRDLDYWVLTHAIIWKILHAKEKYVERGARALNEKALLRRASQLYPRASSRGLPNRYLFDSADAAYFLMRGLSRVSPLLLSGAGFCLPMRVTSARWRSDGGANYFKTLHVGSVRTDEAAKSQCASNKHKRQQATLCAPSGELAR